MDETFLARAPLFHNLGPPQIRQALSSLGAYVKSYDRNAPILHAGDTASHMGLVLSGGVRIEHDDAWGGKSVFSHVGPGGMFGETYACLPGQPLLVTAVAAEPSRVLFLDARPLRAGDPGDPALRQVLANLLQVSLRKNLELSRRMLHTSSKTIRGRLLSYLSEQALLAGGLQFTIPFNRQQLADYLGVDRSALSNELSKLRRDGMLTFSRSTFALSSCSLEPGNACNTPENPVK